MKKTILALLIFISTSPVSAGHPDLDGFTWKCDGTTKVWTGPNGGEMEIPNSPDCMNTEFGSI